MIRIHTNYHGERETAHAAYGRVLRYQLYGDAKNYHRERVTAHTAYGRMLQSNQGSTTVTNRTCLGWLR